MQKPKSVDFLELALYSAIFEARDAATLTRVAEGIKALDSLSLLPEGASDRLRPAYRLALSTLSPASKSAPSQPPTLPRSQPATPQEMYDRAEERAKERPPTTPGKPMIAVALDKINACKTEQEAGLCGDWLLQQEGLSKSQYNTCQKTLAAKVSGLKARNERRGE